jgi:hypothetical protein
MNKTASQNGNAIVMILIAIALFAALGVAFSNTSRTSSSFITDEEAKAYANQIIAYGNEVKSAVKRLQLRGCSDTEISFENNIVSGYENPNSPPDKSCHIFDVAGGGLQWKSPNAKSQTSPINYRINGAHEISNIGKNCSSSECNELLIFLGSLNENICIKINNSQNINSMPENFNYTHGFYFTGTFDDGNVLLASSLEGLPMRGKKLGCFLETSSGNYVYYNTLIAR